MLRNALSSLMRQNKPQCACVMLCLPSAMAEDERTEAGGLGEGAKDGEVLADASSNSNLESLKGPCDLQGLLAWPQRVAEQLWKTGNEDESSCRRRVFQAHLDVGLVAVSDFSGWDSQREGLAKLITEFERMQGLSGCQPWWVRAADLGVFPQKFLKEVALKQGSEACVFQNVCDRLPQDWRTQIEKKLGQCKGPAEKKEASTKGQTMSESGIRFLYLVGHHKLLKQSPAKLAILGSGCMTTSAANAFQLSDNQDQSCSSNSHAASSAISCPQVYTQSEQLLMDSLDEAFPMSAGSWCCVHGCNCPVAVHAAFDWALAHHSGAAGSGPHASLFSKGSALKVWTLASPWRPEKHQRNLSWLGALTLFPLRQTRTSCT